MSPIREYHGHAKGVLGLSWCTQDASFLLSCGKDNRTICWDVTTGAPYCEVPHVQNWSFDVQWAPGQLAGVFATGTYEGQLSLTSLAACTAAAAEGQDGGFVQQLAAPAVRARAPAWLKRPVSASFGFGGRLVKVTNTRRQLPTGESVDTGSIAITQVGGSCRGVHLCLLAGGDWRARVSWRMRSWRASCEVGDFEGWGATIWGSTRAAHWGSCQRAEGLPNAAASVQWMVVFYREV